MKEYVKKMKKSCAAIYSRKSVYSDKSESTENQILLCRKYLREQYPQYEVEVYEDNGFSAGNTQRPEFQRMMEDLRRGKLSMVVCYRLDRISRNISDFTRLIETFSKKGVDFVCLREQFDTSTPMGKAMMYISGVFAQLERETIAERVRDNMLELARRGKRMGGRYPAGYAPQMTRDEALEDWIRRCFSVFLETKSLKATAEQVGGVTPFGLRGILQNPVYCPAERDLYRFLETRGYDAAVSEDDMDRGWAFLPYNRRGKGPGILSVGEHRPLVSGRKFALTQVFLDIVPIKNNYSLLSGMIFCGACGRKLSAQRSGRDAFRYRCKACGYGICGKRADSAAEELIRAAGLLPKDLSEKRIYARAIIEKGEWNGKELILTVHSWNKTTSGNDRCRGPANW